ncbi:hypothetical protein V6N13_033363 [Hibiscus sabdariffa]
MDGAHGEFSPRLDELSHRLRQSREIALVHLVGVILQRFGVGADEADVGEGVDAEELERRLGFAELDVGEEEFGVGVVVVGDEGRGDEGELSAEFGEVEFGFVVELGGVEEDEDGGEEIGYEFRFRFGSGNRKEERKGEKGKQEEISGSGRDRHCLAFGIWPERALSFFYSLTFQTAQEDVDFHQNDIA